MDRGFLTGCWGKKVVAGFLLLLLLLGVSCPAAALEGESRTVRVGYVWSTNFSEGRSDEDYKSGYAYEYLQKIAYYTGWKYEYVYGDWSTILEKLKNGEVDIMAGITATEERRAVMDFPDYPMGAERYYIYVWQNSALAAQDISGLDRVSIGCTEGSMQNHFLDAWNREHGNRCTVALFSGNEALYKAFVSHTIDAVVDTDNAILPSDGLVPVAEVGASDYYLAVSKSAGGLLEELNAALEEVNRVAPRYLENLHEKYFSETAVVMTLSAPEQAWLAEHPVLHVGYLDQYMPYCGTDGNGNATGILVDIFDQIFEKLDMTQPVSVMYTAFPDQKDLIAAVNDGTVDVAFPVYGDIWFSEMQGIYQTSDIANIVVDLVFKGDYSQLSPDRIGVNRKNLIQYQYTLRQYPDAEIVCYDSIEDCLKGILEEEIDCTITNGLRTDLLLRSSIYDSLSVVELSDVFPLSMGVQRGQTALLTLLNHGLSTLDKNFAMINAYQYQKNIYHYTLMDFVRENILLVISIIVLLAAVFAFFLLRDMRRTKDILKQERALAKRLEDALSTAQQANQAKTTFLNNMSHDIRTPMNAIIGFTNIAMKQQNGEEVKRCLEKIAASSEHLLMLINDVLDISRVESGKTAYTPVPSNLCAVTESVVAITQGFLTGKNLDFRVERPQGGHCGVLVDPVRLREILVNLLSNAVKFTGDGGTIVFSMGMKPGTDDRHVRVWYTVSDTGCGMSEAFLPHVFDEFSQENSGARTQYKGTGLGMAITKRYVELMGGTISVSSRKGEGTTFTVELPMMLAEDVTLSEQALPGCAQSLRGVRVLLAEDNDMNAEIATVQLEEAGMEVTRAVNGRQAVEIFAEKPAGTFDVILMDIMMPEMNGYEATRAIRGMASRPDGETIPIIAITANAFAEDVQASLDAGMNGHLSKPIVMEEVLRTVAVNLGNRPC